MKQLNNITIGNKRSGNIIIIDKINNDNIKYCIYENYEAVKNKEYGIVKVIENLDLTNLVLNDEATNEYVLNLIKAVETDFVISTDLKNWHINTGSTGINTTVRVFIPNDAYDIALQNKDNEESDFYNLYQVIIGVQLGLPSNTADVTKNYMVQYLEEIYPQSEAALNYYIENYPELNIVIEYKS